MTNAEREEGKNRRRQVGIPAGADGAASSSKNHAHMISPPVSNVNVGSGRISPNSHRELGDYLVGESAVEKALA